MRRALHLTLFVLLLSLSVPVAWAQDPAKIVEQYVKAAGGSRALSKIQTLAVEGTFTTDDGKSGTTTTEHQRRSRRLQRSYRRCSVLI